MSIESIRFHRAANGCTVLALSKASKPARPGAGFGVLQADAAQAAFATVALIQSVRIPE
jgi:hypothetical protein